MKILLVRPNPASETIGLQHIMIVEPLELEVMAALAAPDDEVRIVDMILEKTPLETILRGFQPDLFCTSGYITHIPTMKNLCALAKRLVPGVRTVVGGVHVEKFPEDADDAAIDFRVVRNATRVFPRLLEHIKYGVDLPAGILQTGEMLRPEVLPNYDFYFPMPRRDLTAKYRDEYFYVFHHKVALMKTSFGCPYKCNFCFCRKITDDHYFARPLDDVISELKNIREKEIYIVDDDFLLSAKRLRAFVNRLREEKIEKKFLVYGRADFIAEHPDIIRDFKKMGLRTVIVGIESFNDTELAHFEKRTTRDINRKAMRILNENGVDCYAAVITSPDWSEEDFRRAGDELLSLGIKFVNLQPLTPLKGTGIEVKDEVLAIRRDDFPRWDLAHVAIRPECMSTSRYYENILQLYERIVFNPKNLLAHALRYPLSIQWKLTKGIWRVRKQYLQRIRECEKFSSSSQPSTAKTEAVW